MIAPSKMHKATADIFRALGMPSDDADLSADTLMFADTRGIDSHGVSNMMKAYVHWLQRYPKVGSVNPNWEMKIERETAAIATVDCDNGLGLCVGPKAMDLAIEKAKACGVGWVVVNNGAPPSNPPPPQTVAEPGRCRLALRSVLGARGEGAGSGLHRYLHDDRRSAGRAHLRLLRRGGPQPDVHRRPNRRRGSLRL